MVPLASHSLSLSSLSLLSLSLSHTHTLCGAFIICFSQAMLVWLLLLCLVHMCVHARSQKLSPERCHEMDAVLERLEHHPDASLIDPLRVLQEAHAIVCQQPQLPPPRQNAPTNHALTPSKHTRSHDHSGEHRYGSDNNNNLNNLNNNNNLNNKRSDDNSSSNNSEINRVIRVSPNNTSSIQQHPSTANSGQAHISLRERQRRSPTDAGTSSQSVACTLTQIRDGR